MERTKDCRGTPQSDRRQNRPVLHVGLPPGPRYGGRIPGAVPRIRRGQGRGLPSFPRRCRWSGNLGRVRQAGRWKARLVQAAVEAGSGNGGPVGTSAPTPNLWVFAGMVSAPTESAAGKPKKAREGRKFPRPDSGDGKSAPDEYIRRWCGWNFGPKPEFFDTRGEEAPQKRFFSRPSYHSPQRHIKGISLKSQ